MSIDYFMKSLETLILNKFNFEIIRIVHKPAHFTYYINNADTHLKKDNLKNNSMHV